MDYPTLLGELKQKYIKIKSPGPHNEFYYVCMSPPTAIEQRVCSKGIRCRHKGLPISIDCFRKGNTLPNCHLFHKTCNDCRSTVKNCQSYTFPGNVPPPSPSGFQRRSAENANVNGHCHDLQTTLGNNARNVNSVEDQIKDLLF